MEKIETPLVNVRNDESYKAGADPALFIRGTRNRNPAKPPGVLSHTTIPRDKKSNLRDKFGSPSSFCVFLEINTKYT